MNTAIAQHLNVVESVKIIAGKNFAQQVDLIQYCESVKIDCGKCIL